MMGYTLDDRRNRPHGRCCDTCTEEDQQRRSRDGTDSQAWTSLPKGTPTSAGTTVPPTPRSTLRKRPRSFSSSSAGVLSPSKRPRSHLNMPHRGPPEAQAADSGDSSLPIPTRKIRTRSHRDAAVAALKTWRYNTILTCYSYSSYTEEGFFSDEMIHSLAHDATIISIDDIRAKLVNPPWIFLGRHGDEVLRELRRVDTQFPSAPPVRKTPSRRGLRPAVSESERENIPPEGLEEAVSDDDQVGDAGEVYKARHELFPQHLMHDALPTPPRTAIKPRPRTGHSLESYPDWNTLSRQVCMTTLYLGPCRC